MTFNLDFLNLDFLKDLLKRYSHYVFLSIYLVFNLGLGIYLYHLYQTKAQNQDLISEKTSLLDQKEKKLKGLVNVAKKELRKLKTEKQTLLPFFSYPTPYALATEIQKFLNELAEKNGIAVIQYRAEETKWRNYPQLRIHTVLQGNIKSLLKILDKLEIQRHNLRIRDLNINSQKEGSVLRVRLTIEGLILT
ncbi:MAG: hypothetical protein AMJ45_04325 [Syntrophobacter sp. DG_60]|nr:MAG: hypothetical protein AMJ45_04325 [Syntrophobacter sp. DG_60]